MDTNKKRVTEAFKEGFNIVGLGGAAALSLAILNPLPLLVGLVAEAAYLLFVPDSRWYMARLSERADVEVAARRAALKNQVFPEIAPAVQKRFDRLEGIRQQIGGQGDMRGQKWFREVVRKLDYLLEKFLMFALKEAQFWRYLLGVRRDVVPNFRPGKNAPMRNADDVISIPVRVTDKRKGKRSDDEDERERERERNDSDPEAFPNSDRASFNRLVTESVQAIQDHYTDEITDLTEKSAAEEDINTRAILDKRIDVLKQRHEYVGKIGKILTNLGHQMDLLEDSFGLINDQIRARPPEQVLADIEGVVYQTDSMTRLIEELSSYDSLGS